MNNDVIKIDKALALYYKLMGRNDYMSNGIGKFHIWCDENGFEGDDIRDELNASFDECTLIDFTSIDNFPFDPTNLNDGDITKNDKMKTILDILKQCFMHGKVSQNNEIDDEPQQQTTSNTNNSINTQNEIKNEHEHENENEDVLEQKAEKEGISYTNITNNNDSDNNDDDSDDE
eukprot:186766_1